MKKGDIEKYKDKIISKLDEDFKNKASEMFENAKNGKVKNIMEKIPYRKVNQEEATKLKEKTGLELEGYEHEISNMDIRHIYNKHGNEKMESFRGQVAVTERDILLIPEITKKYDDIALSPEVIDGRKMLVYKKEIGDSYYYVEAISDKNKSLRSKTMYIRKK